MFERGWRGGSGGGAPRRAAGGRRIVQVVTSPRLALALLGAILGFCVVGVTVFRGERAWELIFSTLWFNGLLVLLAISSATAFFSRIWKRKLTVVQAGMIVFHVSFAGLLAAVVFNGLFHFKGLMRLTEGETLPNGEIGSYDSVEAGRLFDFSLLRGETTLHQMHVDYHVDGKNKRAAYEIDVGEGADRKREIIYVTRSMERDGIRYLCSKEGYSILVLLTGPGGEERYGAHIPLQSLRQEDGAFLYATGTPEGPGGLPFPAPPAQPLGELVVFFRPNVVEARTGEVTFLFVPMAADGAPGKERKGTVKIGEPFDAGDFFLTANEVRYWAGMDVRYDPGMTAILSSLGVGLAGMVLTFVGRVRQGAGLRSREPGAARGAAETDLREEG